MLELKKERERNDVWLERQSHGRLNQIDPCKSISLCYSQAPLMLLQTLNDTSRD